MILLICKTDALMHNFQTKIKSWSALGLKFFHWILYNYQFKNSNCNSLYDYKRKILVGIPFLYHNSMFWLSFSTQENFLIEDKYWKKNFNKLNKNKKKHGSSVHILLTHNIPEFLEAFSLAYMESATKS